MGLMARKKVNLAKSYRIEMDIVNKFYEMKKKGKK